MNRGNIRYTGIPLFASGSGAQAGEVELPRHFADPRPSGISIGGPGGATLSRYFVSSVGPEYITAYGSLADGGIDANGGAVLIAKPPALRRSNFDGRTVGGWRFSYNSDTNRRRTWTLATGLYTLGAIVDEMMEPEYEAAPGAVHGTNYGDRYCIFGMAGEVPSDVLGPTGDHLTILDINVDARRFIWELNAFNVCDNNTQKTVLLGGGPAPP